VFNSAWVGNNPHLVGRASTVHDDATTVRVGLAFTSPKDVILFATADGQGLAALRPSGSSDCLMAGASVWGDRFATKLDAKPSQPLGESGGVLGGFGPPGALPVGFSLMTQPPGAAQGLILGTTRWLWWWAPTYAYTTVSALDGSDYRLIATTMPPSQFIDLESPTTTGNLFFFEGFVGDDAGLAHGKIFYTDGVSPPQVYLEPTEPDTYYGSPIYANSHVAFFKGIQFQDINKYGSVELWASPYSDKPSELKPAKLAVLPYHSMPFEPKGGWGFALIGGTTAEPIGIWNLAKVTERTYALSSDTDRWMGSVGVTRQHAWVVTSNFTWTHYDLLRFRNE
jgi:hypothetical protein